MDFLLTEILARVIGAALAFDCAWMILGGLRDGRIKAFQTATFSPWPGWVVERREFPLMFWIQMGIQALLFLPCLLLAILGWNLPGS